MNKNNTERYSKIEFQNVGMSAKKNSAALICERCWQFKRDAEQSCAEIDPLNGMHSAHAVDRLYGGFQ